MARDGVCYTMALSRNQYGKLAPQMISSDKPAFWRVRKIKDKNIPEIKREDSIQLVWKFSDQPSGIQDFLGDTLGRIRPISAYADLELTLHTHLTELDTRAANIDVGITATSEILAQMATEELMTEVTAMYGLLTGQELQFRLDTIGMSRISFLLAVIIVTT